MGTVKVKLPDGSTAEYVDGGDIDLDTEVVAGLNGRRVTEAEVEELADEAELLGPPSRRPGRPALGGTGAAQSPRISFRVDEDLLAQAAERTTAEGLGSLSELARVALVSYLRS